MLGDDHVPDFKEQLFHSITAFIEAEVEKRLEKALNARTVHLVSELEELQKAYLELNKKYASLQVEMQCSRQAFEKKKQEWPAIKDKLSQKERLYNLLNSLESGASEETPGRKLAGTLAQYSLSEERSAEDPLTQNDLLSDKPDEASCQVSPKESDPLELLLDMASNEGSQCSPQRLQPSTTKTNHDSPVHRDREADGFSSENISVTPKKRTSILNTESLRSKSVRKQAHAKDCPCCTRVCSLSYPFLNCLLVL